MNIYDLWVKALKGTQIIRPRVHGLLPDKDTQVPYIALSESQINPADTVVRKGQVHIEKPALLLPPASPQFEGFEFQSPDAFEQNAFVNFLLVRGVTIPSMRYNNTTDSLDVFEGDLGKAVSFYKDALQRQENVTTGLIVGPQECWQFSVLVYVCSVIVRNADADIRNLLKEFKERSS